MDSENYFLKMIVRVMEHGIYLGEISSSEEYLDSIVGMFNSRSDVFCRYENKNLIIEDSMCNPILSLAISRDTLYVIPAGEDNFFLALLKSSSMYQMYTKEKKEQKKKSPTTHSIGSNKSQSGRRIMKIFYLKRTEDESGVSGTGRIAQGFIFDNGKVALTWLSEHPSVTVYDSIGEVHAIHGHGGKTEVIMEPDYKRAYNEMKSFVDNFKLEDVMKEKLPVEGSAAKLLKEKE